MSDTTTRYAESLLAAARAEGNADQVVGELFEFGRVLETNDQLREALSDPSTPIVNRMQAVDDLLAGQASRVTSSLIAMVVGVGRGGQLGEIIRATVELNAASRDQRVAYVRSAIDLDADQQQRLAAALRESTGDDVEVRVILDPSVLGGLVTEIGDDVIDGSVRRRLNQMRESLS
ncbi:MAG: ATP synthase F1 subunit delta [Acidimicrobiia bacterium]|nr:ATP synthase F1 subunit delta [Acidimicrobiia bacterium]